MTLRITLPAFEGPLDLLLHLIKEHHLDIFDIPMAQITEGYLRYLSLMEELDLEGAGEYLLMAATLVHIKSQMLLPEPAEPAAPDEQPEDPRAELVHRLLEYQRFKEAAANLGAWEADQQLVHRRGAPSELLEVEGPLSLTLPELLRAFQQVLQRAAPGPVLEITPEQLKVAPRMVALLDRLARESPVTFLSLFPAGAPRAELIVTFLALLELLRRGLARARQAEPLGDIMIYRAVEAEGPAPLLVTEEA